MKHFPWRQWLRSSKRLWPAFVLLRWQWWRDQRDTQIEEELWGVERWADPDGMALDIGANNGVYSQILARWFQRVEAFEPNVQLTEGLRRWGPKNVRIYDVALSSDSGDAVLAVPMDPGGFELGGWGTLELDQRLPDRQTREKRVLLKPLDDYGFTNVRFIKIDVEGHEEAVFAGGLRTLENNRPVILCEVKEGRRKTMDQYLERLSYQAFTWSEGRWVPCPNGLERYAGTKENFLFVPQEAWPKGAIMEGSKQS